MFQVFFNTNFYKFRCSHSKFDLTLGFDTFTVGLVNFVGHRKGRGLIFEILQHRRRVAIWYLCRSNYIIEDVHQGSNLRNDQREIGQNEREKKREWRNSMEILETEREIEKPSMMFSAPMNYNRRERVSSKSFSPSKFPYYFTFLPKLNGLQNGKNRNFWESRKSGFSKLGCFFRISQRLQYSWFCRVISDRRNIFE